FRYSALPALCLDGIFYSHIRLLSYTGNDFLKWLEGLLMEMNPYLGPRSVLVLNICYVHHVPGVAEMCEE
ncbi:hypothetical protein F5876DRAFT_20653, partial [Lentinula aff. lateritia]